MINFESNMSEAFIRASDELDDGSARFFAKLMLEAEIVEKRDKGIELFPDDIKELEEKYYKMYRNSIIEDRRKNSLDEKKKRLKEKHSINNPKNINKSYDFERRLCKKYLIDKGDKIYFLITEIREVYYKNNLLKFIRLMYIYEKALELGLASQSMETAFSEYICTEYREYADCFEDIHKVIKEFSIINGNE